MLFCELHPFGDDQSFCLFQRQSTWIRDALSVHAASKVFVASTNTTPFQVTRRSCASSNATRWLVVADGFSPSQSTGTDAMGSSLSPLDPVDSSTPCFASLPRRALRRYPSTVRAVCVNALVRICAGRAISDDRPYRDSNSKQGRAPEGCDR